MSSMWWSQKFQYNRGVLVVVRQRLAGAGKLWVVGSCLAVSSALATNDFKVLTAAVPEFKPSEMMEVYLKKLAFEALERRESAYERVASIADLEAWQAQRREIFLNALGAFPERTPLNARSLGQKLYADYRVEKILFESQPGLVVSALLYLPLTTGPYPAVVHPTGHSANAKARDVYQQASILLAKNGIACLCYDPLGQGERRQIFGADGKPLFSTTQEHNLMGVGSTLLGTSVARYMIWDGMRAVDYLQSRDDIQAERIGAMGISGGGTMSSYLGALDERIAVSAPGCYLTGFRALLTKLGPQDAEQNLYGQIANGLDHGDFVMMRAVRPTLIMAATRDYFPVEGSWQIFREAKRFYTRFGFSERVELIEPDTTHGFPTEMRVGATRWMRRWFFESNAPVLESDCVVMTDAEAQVTPEGQVLQLPGARSFFELNREWEQRCAVERRQLWQDPVAALQVMRRVAGIRPLAQIAEPKVVSGAVRSCEGYVLEHLIIEPEAGIKLPALKFTPNKNTMLRPVLYFHGEGKQVDAGPQGPIEKLVEAGHTVLAVDARGIGETAPASAGRGLFVELLGNNMREVSLAHLLGKTFVAMRAEDVLACARYLAGAGAGVILYAQGEMGVPALHAAVLEPQMFTAVKLVDTLRSWSEVLDAPLARKQNVNTVFGALHCYDLPDLVKAHPAQEITLVNPRDATGTPLRR